MSHVPRPYTFVSLPEFGSVSFLFLGLFFSFGSLRVFISVSVSVGLCLRLCTSVLPPRPLVRACGRTAEICSRVETQAHSAHYGGSHNEVCSFRDPVLEPTTSAPTRVSNAPSSATWTRPGGQFAPRRPVLEGGMVALMAQKAIDRGQATRNQLAASRDPCSFEITSFISQNDLESAQMTQGYDAGQAGVDSHREARERKFCIAHVLKLHPQGSGPAFLTESGVGASTSTARTAAAKASLPSPEIRAATLERVRQQLRARKIARDRVKTPPPTNRTSREHAASHKQNFYFGSMESTAASYDVLTLPRKESLPAPQMRAATLERVRQQLRVRKIARDLVKTPPPTKGTFMPFGSMESTASSYECV